MRAYSLDLRQHLLDAICAGTSKRQAAEVFGVSVRTVNRYLKQLSETGQLAAKPLPGRVRQIRPAQHPDLEAQLRAHDDATLTVQCELWHASHGVRLSRATMSRAIARLGWSWKKSHWWPPSGTRMSVDAGGILWPSGMPASSSSLTSRVPISR